MVFAEKKTAAAATTYKADDPVAKLIATAEGNLISTTPGAVPPHLDDGGHLPFGGIDGGTHASGLLGTPLGRSCMKSRYFQLHFKYMVSYLK